MPLTCGVTLNLNNLKGDLTTRAQAMLNINMGTPEGLSELAGKLESELSAIKDKVLDVVVIPPELYTLRDALAELAALPFASLAAAAKIVSIAADYLGVTNLRGYANLNLTDLAKSVFSVTGTFDPCSASIPNIALSDGKIMSLPAIQPILGATDAALSVEAPDRSIIDNLGNALKDNMPIVDDLSKDALTQALEAEKSMSEGLSSALSQMQTQAPALLSEIQAQTPALVNKLQEETPAAVEQVQSEVTKAMSGLEKNVVTSLSGMDNMIRQLPSGQEVVETQDFLVTRLQNTSLPLLQEVALPDMSSLTSSSSSSFSSGGDTTGTSQADLFRGF